MKLTKQSIKLTIASKLGFIVSSIEFKSDHACFSWATAMEWMRCYPQGDFVVVRKNGSVIATRNN